MLSGNNWLGNVVLGQVVGECSRAKSLGDVVRPSALGNVVGASGHAKLVGQMVVQLL